MTRYSEEIDQFLIEFRTGITNSSQDPDIMAALYTYRYNLARMQEGIALCNDLELKHSNKKKEDDEQHAASREAENILKFARDRYIDYVKIGRRLYNRDETYYVKLGLAGDRERSLHGVVGQATRFYETALSDNKILRDYEYFNINRDKLQEGFNLVKDAQDAAAIQDKEEAEAQRATVIRDKAYEKAYDWWMTFKTVARIALKDEPHLLEKIGIIVS